MSVEKASMASLVHEGIAFTTLINESIQSIKNPDAMAIWTYLMSKSSGWQVRSGYLQEHFGIGRHRYQKAARELREMGLISHQDVRDEKGRLLGRQVVVHAQPNKSQHNQQLPPKVRSSDLRMNRPSDEPKVGQSAPLLKERGFYESKEVYEKQDCPANAEAGANPEKPKRPRDPIWDTLMEVCGIDPGGITKSARGGFNRAVKELKEVGAAPDDIRHRAARWHKVYPGATLTPTALVKHWASLAGSKPKEQSEGRIPV